VVVRQDDNDGCRGSGRAGQRIIRHDRSGADGCVDQPVHLADGHQASADVSALSNAGRFVDKWTANGFDLLRFATIPAPDFQPPNTYKGTSGGGAWRLFVTKHDDGRYTVRQRRLVGVAFWEDPRPHGMDLICHGTESVYDRLRDAVRARWPLACI